MHASDYVSGQVNPHVDKSITNVLCLDWPIRVMKHWFELTSTSKLTSSPSRKTIVQTRPFLIGGACWCFPIEWILPFELSKLGRNFEFGWWLASSFNAVDEFLVCRRLKKRMNRAAAINQVPCTNGSDVSIIKTIIILKKQKKQGNDVIIESTRRSSTTRATTQTECIVHRSIIRGEGERKSRRRRRRRRRRRKTRDACIDDGRGTARGAREDRTNEVRSNGCQPNEPQHILSERERDVYRWWGV